MSATPGAPRPSTASAELGLGPFALDLRNATVKLRGSDLALRPKEFDLLAYLVQHAGRVVSKDELLDHLWPSVIVTEDSLTRTVSDLRAALGEAGHGAIRTVHRRGYALAWPVQLHHEQPGPNGSTSRPGAPAPVAAPIGRAGAVADLSALLDRERVVSIVGPAGVGKTHLAKWVAQARAQSKAHGAAFLDLSALDDTAPLEECMIAAVGLGDAGVRGLAALVSHLRSLDILVVIDNVEHLVDAAARLVAAVAAGAPQVQMIVTSQRPLRIAGEALYRLPPLDLPASEPVDQAAATPNAPGCGALAMLTWRLRELGWPIEATDAPHLRRICICTDGLPLAIELAASRVPQYGAQRVHELLKAGLDLLDHGRRDASLRHASVRTAVLWSVRLLSPSAQEVFTRLGVFEDGFTLEAACQTLTDPGLSDADVVRGIGTLVEASLLAHARASDRYRLLEPVRIVARELLDQLESVAQVRDRHVRWYREYFSEALGSLPGLKEQFDTWRSGLLAEANNARAACRRALSTGDAESAIVLAACLADALGSEWPSDRRQLLELTEPFMTQACAPSVTARWWLAAANECAAARPSQAHAYATRAVGQFKELGDRAGQYRALGLQLYCASMTPGDHLHGDIAGLKAVFDPRWSDLISAEGANAIACWLSAQRELASCLAWRRRTLALYARAGWRWRVCAAQANVCDTLLASGDTEGAIEAGEQLLASLGGTRYLPMLPAVRLNLAAAYLQNGDPAGARSLADEGWQQAMDLGWSPYWSDHLALMAALEGQFQLAAQLLGFGDASYRRIGAEREINEANAAQRANEIARASLGNAEFQRWRHSGEALNERDVQALLRAQAGQPDQPC